MESYLQFSNIFFFKIFESKIDHHFIWQNFLWKFGQGQIATRIKFFRFRKITNVFDMTWRNVYCKILPILLLEIIATQVLLTSSHIAVLIQFHSLRSFSHWDSLFFEKNYFPVIYLSFLLCFSRWLTFREENLESKESYWWELLLFSSVGLFWLRVKSLLW